VTGAPKYYADSSETVFIIAPTPDSTYAYEIKYQAKPTSLTSSNTTNYYALSCPDTLFYATMMEMAIFNKAYGDLKVWADAYTVSRDSWNVSVKRKRRDNGTNPNSPDDGPNTLAHTSQTNA